MQSETTPQLNDVSTTLSTRSRISWPHVVLAIAGIGTSAWALYAHFRIKAGDDSGCGVTKTFNCDAVLTSSYSQVASIPLGAWGIAFFVFVLLVSTWKENAETALHDERKARLLQLALGAAGFAGSLVMLYISHYIIGAWCKICLSTHTVTLFLFLVSLWCWWKARAHSDRTKRV